MSDDKPAEKPAPPHSPNPKPPPIWRREKPGKPGRPGPPAPPRHPVHVPSPGRRGR